MTSPWRRRRCAADPRRAGPRGPGRATPARRRRGSARRRSAPRRRPRGRRTGSRRPGTTATMTVPRSTLWPATTSLPAGDSVTFSGRTPILTASLPCGPIRSLGTCSVAPSCVSTVEWPFCEARILASTRFEIAEEVRHELGPRALVEVGRAAGLLDPAVVHHGDRVGHRHGLLLVVRDVHERDPDVLLDPLELDLELLAQAQVERAERLVEQQRPRPVDERAGERDALLLAAGELRRLALAVLGRAGPSRAPRRRAC